MGAMPIISKSAGGDAALAPPPAPADIPADAPVVSPRHYGRMIGALALAAFCVWVIYTLANGAIDWGTVPGYFVDHRIIQGVFSTLKLTVIAMAVGISVGVLLAVMRQSANPVFRVASASYIWLFRAIPTLVQLLLWYN